MGPNGGIEPPEFITATPTGAAGTAEPGARVLVFLKQSDEPGEIESFLGEDVANASGNWEVAYGSAILDGTFIAATQTNVQGGTSELGFRSNPGGTWKGVRRRQWKSRGWRRKSSRSHRTPNCDHESSQEEDLAPRRAVPIQLQRGRLKLPVLPAP